jgi:SAM-dependent methyltransferase
MMYEQLAHLYDWDGSLDFAERIFARDTAILEALGIQRPARILDLACGTGTLALALAQAGDTVIGLDRSAAMLDLARQKQAARADGGSLNLPLNVQWIRADMCSFTLDEPVDAVLCHSDSLNHLPDEDALRMTLRQVARALKPGGCLIFDLNTLENYRTFWNGSDTDEGPNYRLKATSAFDEATAAASVCFQAQEYNGDGELLIREETVHERYFEESTVEKFLLDAGFGDIHREDLNPADDIPADIPLKTLWHCRRA